MIDCKEISVVVQGPINKKETPKTLKSIRTYLPDAEIVLSTWENSDVSDLDYDILVLNKDPGNVLMGKFKRQVLYNNMNRQLLSTQAGLKKSQRKYTLKLRSDLILTQNEFLKYFDMFQERTEDYKLFERKILTSALFTRYNIRLPKEKKQEQIPFHISDWWFFGLTEDLKTYFIGTQLAKEPDFTKYFDKPENKNKKTPYSTAKFKFAPEQYFGYECFRRNFKDIYMEDAADYNEEINLKSQKCIVNNFIVLEYEQSGIYLNKYAYSKNEKLSGTQYIRLYNFYRYENEYKKHCDLNYKISTKGLMYENETYGHALLRVYKHLFVLVDSNTRFLRRLEQLVLGLPVSIICLIPIFLKIKLVGDNNDNNQ